MSQTPFRSVGQQRRTEATNVKRSAPDRTRQTNELARQQNLEFDNLQTVIGIDQKLQLSNRLVLFLIGPLRFTFLGPSFTDFIAGIFILVS